MPKVNPEIETFARIKVIGVGGSGKGALNHMISSKVKGVEFISMNTDTQDLHNSLAEKKIHIGKNLTKGLGAGMNPDVGKRAAEETRAEIQDTIKGADMVFIACGMGGGTGTGAAPIVAKSAKEQGILTVAVVTKPFFFEGATRMKIAERGIEELAKEVDAIIVIPNDKLLQLSDKNTNVKDGFAVCNEVLRQAVEGISDLITTPGIINVDFADIKAIMSDAGSALMGIGSASGEKRAEKAAFMAINSPLLEVSINGAKGVLFAISGGDDLTIHEIQEAAKVITESIDKDAKVIFGTIHDEKLKKGEVKVTVIATSFPADVPRPTKSLFGSSPIVNISVKEDKSSNNVNNAKKEIHNAVSSVISQQPKNDFFKPIEKKEVPPTNTPITPTVTATTNTTPAKATVVEDIIIDDDTEDWSAVPAFFRRNKK
ncbi:MAG: cell division protein FtsZ [Candidatus Nomurabacteria bacterium]|nr:cell division protein FtsZ [Candidatus Nomurabacteria bacterium]